MKNSEKLLQFFERKAYVPPRSTSRPVAESDYFYETMFWMVPTFMLMIVIIGLMLI